MSLLWDKNQDPQNLRLDKALRKLAHRLCPTSKYSANARQAVNTIVKVLQESPESRGFGIDRSYTGGSMGKKTTVIFSDCDEVLFVNIESIDCVKDVLDSFETALLNSKSTLLKELSPIEKTDFSLQFSYDGFDMDVLPAINLANRAIRPTTKKSKRRMSKANKAAFKKLAAEQALATLLKIGEDTSKAYNYSSALVESALRFMKEQSCNIHSFVRICKFWNKSLLIGKKISGRSTLIELIAVHCGQQEEKRIRSVGGKFRMLRAFTEFLRLMENFPQLNLIDFGFDPLKGSGSSINLLTQGQGLAGLYHKVAHGKALVVEPSNPYNNIAKGVKDDEAKLFQAFATATLAQLQHLEKFRSGTKLPLDQLFEPQPGAIPFKWNKDKTEEEQRSLMQIARFLVDVDIVAGEGLLSPSIKVRNKEKFRGMEGVFKHLQTALLVIVRWSATACRTNFKRQSDAELVISLKKRVNKYIDEHVRARSPDSMDFTSFRQHEDMEVTFTVSCKEFVRGRLENFIVRVSLSCY